MKRIIYLTLLLLVTLPVWAAEETAVSSLTTGNIATDILVWVAILTSFMVLGAAFIVLKVVKLLSNELVNPVPLAVLQEQHRKAAEAKLLTKQSRPSFINRFMGLRPVSEEKDIMMEHEFDGIAELDNPTPTWFMGLFYITIVIGIGYMLTYHVFNWAPLQDEEYAIEVTQAETAKQALLAKSTDKIDENTIELKNDAATLASGAAIFKANCIACHGDKGQGLVGPNLTDDYWLHGGDIKKVFKTIKYGVPEKGMIAWEKGMSPKMMASVTNYVLSLKGSNPANAKAPQGIKE